VDGRIIKMDLRGRGYKGVNWIKLTQDEIQVLALSNTVINFEIYKCGKCLKQMNNYQFLKTDPSLWSE
jgi:hypothetical protein